MGKDKRKPLVELDGPNGKVKMFWEAGRDAASFYGFSPVYLSHCVKGKAKHAKKKYFRYATEEEIALYRNVTQRIEEEAKAVPDPTKQVIDIPNITVETIPEKVEKPLDDLTPFDRLLQKGREKLI